MKAFLANFQCYVSFWLREVESGGGRDESFFDDSVYVGSLFLRFNLDWEGEGGFLSSL